MAGAILTAERLRELLSYNPDTGLFTWRVAKGSRAPIGGVANYRSRGYVSVRIDGRLYRAHRLAWLYMNGEWPEDQIDHINMDRSDNRFSNLREANNRQNHQNIRKANIGSRSKYLGVSWHKKACKWVAQIRIKGSARYLGLYETEEAARDAYLEAKRANHPFGMI